MHADLGAAARGLHEAAAVLRHPRVSAADKKKKVRELLSGHASPLTIRFMELLIEKKRFELLPFVAGTVGKLIAEKNNTAKAVVRAARPLSAEAQQKLKDRLKAFAGKNVELEVKEDPEIIGGLIVRLGDWVLDSSLRGQLKTMKEKINGN